MSRFTRRFQRHASGGTLKDSPLEEREGILDKVGSDIKDVANSAFTTLEDAGLRIAGLQRVDENEPSIDKTPDEDNAKPGIGSKMKAAVLGTINQALDSDMMKDTVKAASEDTAVIASKLANIVNDAYEEPEVKAEVDRTIRNAGELTSVIIDASREPFNKAVDVAAEAVPRATSAALSGSIKVGTDAMAAIPGVGGIIELGKMINDGSKAASAMVEAGTDMVEGVSDMVIETKENLEKQKKLSQQIANRTMNSIKQFENPQLGDRLSDKKGGSKKKSKRRLIRRKKKTKRVSFAI